MQKNVSLIFLSLFANSYAGAGAQSAAGESEFNGNMDFLEETLNFDNFDVYLPNQTFRPT